ncbi:MAG TPA: DinB family protein [Pseudonocardia sp.]|nr:DinB family protein [Pseudonocardia sp.]
MTQPAAPEPDDKDWTWTLLRACPECGFDAGAVRGQDVPGIVQEVIARFGRRLADPDAATRPQPQVWSPAEYACHIRDVCTVFDQRLHAMLAEHDPLFENWDQDATALEKQYWRQQPAAVATEMAAAGAEIIATIRGVVDEQWMRPGRRSNGSMFTVVTLVQYLAHDLAHHAHDIGCGLREQPR